MSGMTYTKDELKVMIEKMESISSAFYSHAVRVGCHPFIEFTGFMNEYIKLCHNALAENVDFAMASVHSGGALPIKDYEADYIGEKFECIFGPTFAANPEAAKVFVERVFPGFTLRAAAKAICDCGRCTKCFIYAETHR
jgi:hypothetical protein